MRSIKLLKALLIISSLWAFSACSDVDPNDVAVYAREMNVLYVGIENPIAITVPGIPREKIKVETSNGTVKFDTLNNKYFATLDNAGGTIISVSIEKNGTWEAIKEFSFRSDYIPKPTPTYAGQSGGRISADKWASAKGLVPVLKGFHFDFNFEIESFTVFVLIYDGHGLYNGVEEKIKGGQVSKRMLKLFSKQPPGNKIFFEDIIVKMPDGSKSKLGDLIYVVDKTSEQERLIKEGNERYKEMSDKIINKFLGQYVPMQEDLEGGGIVSIFKGEESLILYHSDMKQQRVVLFEDSLNFKTISGWLFEFDMNEKGRVIGLKLKGDSPLYYKKSLNVDGLERLKNLNSTFKLDSVEWKFSYEFGMLHIYVPGEGKHAMYPKSEKEFVFPRYPKYSIKITTDASNTKITKIEYFHPDGVDELAFP